MTRAALSANTLKASNESGCEVSVQNVVKGAC